MKFSVRFVEFLQASCTLAAADADSSCGMGKLKCSRTGWCERIRSLNGLHKQKEQDNVGSQQYIKAGEHVLSEHACMQTLRR